MAEAHFVTETGVVVPAVTETQMREVDRIAVEEFGLQWLQMMENAGRTLAVHALELLGGRSGSVAILAGAGGNGGGGLCCARHLHNRGLKVYLFLDRDPAALGGVALTQLQILQHAGLQPFSAAETIPIIRHTDLVIDALIGYSLRGSPRGRTRELIEICNRAARPILSLDVPSGMDATSGEVAGPVVVPRRTLTLALPKTGLCRLSGELYVADIGLPPEVFRRVGIQVEPFFGQEYSRHLRVVNDG
jgi:NAD(P)H-hydrate epimerase